VEPDILLVGLSHHTAPVEIRERLAFANGRLEPALRDLVALPEVAEGAIVSTCNRVEVMVVSGGDGARVAPALLDFLARTEGVSPKELGGCLYLHRGPHAVRHLFRVASSLDSMVVGEPQILGQMKEQYAVAAAVGASGRILHRCFHRSFSVAKRIRSETGIAERAVSIGSAAAELAGDIFDRFDDKAALLIGAGTMGELTARQLLARGTGSLMVANRTYERAIGVARRLGGMPVPAEKLTRYLPLADLVVGAVGGEEFAVGAAQVTDAMRERRWRPMFFIDLSVPRCFDPAIHGLDGVYLYDIDDLQGVMAENRDARALEAQRAEAIVDHEVQRFWHWLEGLRAVPTIVALRDKMERIRARESARLLATLDPSQRDQVDRLTRAIVNKILHEPVTALRAPGTLDEEGRATELVRALFGLDEADED